MVLLSPSIAWQMSIKGMASCGTNSASLSCKFVFLKVSSLELCGLMYKLQRRSRLAVAVGWVKLKAQGPV